MQQTICDTNTTDFILKAKQVLALEAAAITRLSSTLDESFSQICSAILACHGKIIVTGMGKSGHIAKKIAATMVSTGTMAWFMHPGEAVHGDLGIVESQDLVLIISNSGETDELVALIPNLKATQAKIILLTSNPNSRLARNADWIINLRITSEACPLNLAPTTSTTCALAMGDALAMSVLHARKFDRQNFAQYHPAGKLGKRLLWRVADIMHSGDKIPLVTATTPLLDGIVEMSKKCFGLLLISADPECKTIAGVFSDGDLRRVVDAKVDLQQLTVSDVANPSFRTIAPNELLITAVKLMQAHKIFTLPVMETNQLVGIFNMHDVLATGIV